MNYKTLIFTFVTYFCAITATFSQDTEKVIEKQFRSEYGFKIWVKDGNKSPMQTYIIPLSELTEFLQYEKLEWLNNIPDFFKSYTGQITIKGVYVYYESGYVTMQKDRKMKFRRLTKSEIKEMFK